MQQPGAGLDERVIDHNPKCNAFIKKMEDCSIQNQLNNHVCRLHAFPFKNEIVALSENFAFLSWDKLFLIRSIFSLLLFDKEWNFNNRQKTAILSRYQCYTRCTQILQKEIINKQIKIIY